MVSRGVYITQAGFIKKIKPIGSLWIKTNPIEALISHSTVPGECPITDQFNPVKPIE
jgi:hypothetical protein